MKLLKIAVTACSIILASCSNDSDLDVIDANLASDNIQTKAILNPDFIIENGYINFSNMEAYDKVVNMLKDKSKEDLLEWSKSIGFNSLLASYNSMDLLMEEESNENDTDLIPFRMFNKTFSSIYNSDGVMVINDTIYKVINEYVYIVANKDFETMNKLDKESSKNDGLSIVSKYKHTEPLKVMNSTRSVSDGGRSHILDVSSKRREFAEFRVNLSTATGNRLYLDIEMVGRAQKKTLWWGRHFDDEFVWAQFHCRGGSFNDRIFFDGFTSEKIFDKRQVGASQYLGISTAIDFVKTTVEFTFTKNAVAQNQFYSNQYYRSN